MSTAADQADGHVTEGGHCIAVYLCCPTVRPHRGCVVQDPFIFFIRGSRRRERLFAMYSVILFSLVRVRTSQPHAQASPLVLYISRQKPGSPGLVAN
jgi:hypothetical protein